MSPSGGAMTLVDQPITWSPAKSVRDQDVRDRLAAQCAEQRLDMPGNLRPRVDDRDLAMSDDVGARALEGEGAGVARDDAADERRHRRCDAVVDIDVTAKGNLGGHVALSGL